MPRGQPLFLEKSSVPSPLLLFFLPGLGRATWEQIRCSLYLFSCEMTAVSQHSVSLFSSLSMWQPPQEEGPDVFLLPRSVSPVLRMPRRAGGRRGAGRPRSPACRGPSLSSFPALPACTTKMPFSVLLLILLNTFLREHPLLTCPSPR